MKDKLRDSENEVRKTRKEYNETTDDYKKHVPINGIANRGFVMVMNRETEKTWRIGKKKNMNKINTLLKRRKENNAKKKPQNRQKREINSIKYRDKELDLLEKQNHPVYSNRPEVYGGATISTKSEMILSKEPGFMILDKIDDIEVEVEIDIEVEGHIESKV